MTKVEELSHEHAAFYEDMGYSNLYRIDGKIIGLGPFLFTHGIIIGMDETGYEYRYCYHNAIDAHSALMEWIADGDDKPKEYIKRKPDQPDQKDNSND